ncbi:hypothetical protein [Brumicola pallidula]|uniref:Uncharacterized protein n=1 Tax=Brumicola pallidula DSM 14239 = ACAM 615 TaxID=1121922 RepID=K6Y734_9ALTE|nr:hypothetical protein [Glaciecola pallidula]GAC28594.1 hypothetical protein GPAL_1731 [Glaciecola pallidula DSM 14239 = ACAM 615]
MLLSTRLCKQFLVDNKMLFKKSRLSGVGWAGAREQQEHEEY